MVSRDRDGVYAEGGYSGAPRAQQVADRFHLVQNLIRAVEDELAHQRPRLLMPAQEFVRNDAPEKAAVVVSKVVPSQRRGPRPSLRPQEIHSDVGSRNRSSLGW